MRVRPGRAGDIQAIRSLFQVVEELHAELLPRFFRRPRRPSKSDAELARLLALPAGGAETLLVIEDEAETIVGLAHVQLYDTPPTPTLVVRRRAHVEDIVVAAAARRTGIGTRLMEAAGDWAHSRGAEELLLTVWAGNEAAEKFYASLGFTRLSSVLARPLAPDA